MVNCLIPELWSKDGWANFGSLHYQQEAANGLEYIIWGCFQIKPWGLPPPLFVPESGKVDCDGEEVPANAWDCVQGEKICCKRLSSLENSKKVFTLSWLRPLTRKNKNKKDNKEDSWVWGYSYSSFIIYLLPQWERFDLGERIVIAVLHSWRTLDHAVLTAWGLPSMSKFHDLGWCGLTDPTFGV